MGYKIAKSANAAGGWIGGHKVGGQIAYRINPGAKKPAGKWSKVQVRAKVKKRRATARAAWIISKYGTYRDRSQAAAVQVALHHLLAGGRWRVTGKAQRPRIRQTGAGDTVRHLAKVMLKQSKRFAGPFKVKVSATRPTVGASSTVRVRVLSRKGKPIKKLPLTVSFSGSGEKKAVTASGGRASATFSKPKAGRHKVVVRVSRVPASKLRLRSPRSGSRVALAGGKTTLVRSHVAIVRAQPRIKMKPAKTVVKPRAKVKGKFRVTKSLGKKPRRAVISLHGPFVNPKSVSCSSRTVATKKRAVRGNVARPLVRSKLRKRGLYVWKVELRGNDMNAPAKACGGLVKVRSTPRVLAKSPKDSYRVGSKPRATVLTRKLSGYAGGRAKVRLFGPFSQRSGVRCISKKRVRQVSVKVTKNGSVRAPRVKVTAKGWYGWRAILPADSRHRSVKSKCGTTASTFGVK